MKMPLDLLPSYGDSFSPAEFVRRIRPDDRNVRAVRIQPPRLGEAGFGSLRVEYRSPVFRLPVPEP
jgi:hypothetical protein